MKRLCVVLMTLAGLTLSSAALACNFCIEQRGTTLVGDFKVADAVLLGKFEPAKGGRVLEESDFRVKEVIKPHVFLRGKETISVPGLKPVKNPFVIFVELIREEANAYRGIEVTEGSDFVGYLKGALKLAAAPPQERLRFAFNYLQSEEGEVSLDAYREFAQAEYKDYKEMALSLPPETIAGWLNNPRTPSYRYGLYASLLGHAGLKDAAKYGRVLKESIDDPVKRRGSGIDGLLAGFAMLQPKEALTLLQNRMSDTSETFPFRYACLRTVRFLWNERPDLVAEKDLVECVLCLARTPDMSDIAIEDLRTWNRWETLPEMLKLAGASSHANRIAQKAILRYAIHAAAQGNQQAKDYVASQDTTLVEQLRAALDREVDVRMPYRKKK